MYNTRNLKTFLFSLMFAFGSLNVFSQSDTLYLDESDKIVNKTIFKRKENSSLYRAIRFSTDTLVLEKLRFKFYFGSLSAITKNQLNLLLYKRHQIDTTKTLIIHYQDTLKRKLDFPEKSSIKYYDSLGNEVKVKKSYLAAGDLSQFKRVVKHEHIIGYYDFLSAHKKCDRKHEKYKKTAIVIHLYKHNLGHPTEYEGLTWYKDYGGVVRKIFSDSYKNFQHIIIHPNGEFYVGFRHDFPYGNLVKNKKWDEYKNEFNRRFEALNKY